MSAKAVREGDAKALLNRFIQHQFLKKLNRHIYDPRYTSELTATFNTDSVLIRTMVNGSEFDRINHLIQIMFKYYNRYTVECQLSEPF